jgi:hypothetical protein
MPSTILSWRSASAAHWIRRARQWRELLARVDSVELCPGRDKFSWYLEPWGKFSIKSMYAKLSEGTTVAHFKDMWEAKVPIKNKILS